MLQTLIVFQYQFGSNTNYDLLSKMQRINYLCGKIKHTLLSKTQFKTVIKFYKSWLYHLSCMAVNDGF
jgi:hypothetical protein